MAEPTVVVLFDVDNTLLDNDRIAADLTRHLDEEIGTRGERRYWAIFEELQSAAGYVDYLGALQRYRQVYPRDPHLLTLSRFLLNYPFAERFVSCRLRGGAADGRVEQPRHPVGRRRGVPASQDRSLRPVWGRWKAMSDLYSQEKELDDVEQRYPADHYVLVDDKLRILTAVKAYWENGSRRCFHVRAIMRPIRRCCGPFRPPTCRLIASAICCTSIKRRCSRRRRRE